MGYGTNGLTFNTLRAANIKRLPLFKDAKGRIAHSKEDGSDWSHAEWLQAVIGELGEYANLRKKVLRGDMTFEEALPALTDELADVIIYMDILAMQLGVDLGEAIMEKWNKTSKKVGVPLYIDAEDWHYTRSPNDRSVDELDLSVRIANCLYKAGITTIGVLRSRNDDELKAIGFTAKMLKQIADELRAWEKSNPIHG